MKHKQARTEIPTKGCWIKTASTNHKNNAIFPRRILCRKLRNNQLPYKPKKMIEN